MSPEQKLWLRLRPHFPSGCHVTRIENTTCSGVPDVNFCLDGIEYWLELKIVTERGAVLRKFQYAWGKQRILRQGRVYIIGYDSKEQIYYLQNMLFASVCSVVDREHLLIGIEDAFKSVDPKIIIQQILLK